MAEQTQPDRFVKERIILGFQGATLGLISAKGLFDSYVTNKAFYGAINTIGLGIAAGELVFSYLTKSQTIENAKKSFDIVSNVNIINGLLLMVVGAAHVTTAISENNWVEAVLSTVTFGVGLLGFNAELMMIHRAKNRNNLIN